MDYVEIDKRTPRYCEKCGRTMNADNFYKSNNTEKYFQGGYVNVCKKCMTLTVDNDDPSTYMNILKELDVPYVPKEWDKIRMRKLKDKADWTGMSILGPYLSVMRIKQYKDFRFADTEKLQELDNNKTEISMKNQGYTPIQIKEALQKHEINMEEIEEMANNPTIPEPTLEEVEEEEKLSHAEYFNKINQEIEDSLDLTEEDKQMLCLKWGKSYSAPEWVRLEQLYTDMMNSYDIQTEGHRMDLKLLCKTYLKANQLLDIDDVEGYQKMQKAYESLMKSGKFSAAQNKSDKGDYIDSFSELVAICETKGFIPRYYQDTPQDKVDAVLLDLKNYTRSLVTEEMGLGNMIENALKEIQDTKEKEARVDDTDEEEDIEEDLFDEHPAELTDADYEEFQQLQEEWAEEDKQ